MPRFRMLLLAAVLPLTALPAQAQDVPAPPPPGAIKGVEFLANIPELKTAISLNFIGNTMFASTTTGIYAYDVSNPAAPAILGALPQYIWENEDVDVDPVRKLLFLSRDPRGFTTPAYSGFPYGAVQVIDVSIPHAMTQISMTLLPGGHTTSCVDKCNYTWTGGPSTGVGQPADWKGRPIFGLDMRDPAKPVACPEPLDLGRNDGKTDYAHDVQVDARGVAWVSGRGGVRGYWVNGKHRDPVTGVTRVATGCAPIPYGGGGTELGRTGPLMHNSWHNTKLAVNGRKGDVLMATEENLSSACQTSGRFVTYDLGGTYGGAGFRGKPHRMRELDTWTPEQQEGADGCASAHYFTDRGDGLVAIAFYGQGTRFLDVRNPRNIKQVAYFRPNDANTWAAYWRPGGLVFIADNERGVDVVRFGTAAGKAGAAPVQAPPAPKRPSLNLPSDQLGWLCATPKSMTG
ncbi:MAG TPA: hypothetical protein VNA30_03160 [Mycobacteriales bacterium]|nr:hypothetical protein [Mycobacteriales bacterium]